MYFGCKQLNKMHDEKPLAYSKIHGGTILSLFLAHFDVIDNKA